METAVGDDKVGRLFLYQSCYHFRCQTSSVNGTPHMSVNVANLPALTISKLCGFGRRRVGFIPLFSDARS